MVGKGHQCPKTKDQHQEHQCAKTDEHHQDHQCAGEEVQRHQVQRHQDPDHHQDPHHQCEEAHLVKQKQSWADLRRRRR